MEPQKVDQILAEDTTVGSIYEKKGTSDDNVQVIDTISDDRLTPNEVAEEKNVKEELNNALKRLPERERTILVLYYSENMTLKDIGDMINISESRVCQLHAQALMKLKNILSDNRVERLKHSII